MNFIYFKCAYKEIEKFKIRQNILYDSIEKAITYMLL